MGGPGPIDELTGGHYRKAENKARRETEAQIAEQVRLAKQQADSISASLRKPTIVEEPLKDATDAADNARINTDRKQMLRRGLMSTFTRYSRPSAAVGSTAGKSTLLGG